MLAVDFVSRLEDVSTCLPRRVRQVGRGKLTIRSWNTDDEAFARLQFIGKIDLVSWAALHELNIWLAC